MTYEEDMKKSIKQLEDITIPTDTSKSRLNKPARSEMPDDVATAGDRIEAFWKKHEGGSILTDIEHREVDNATVYTARVFVRKDSSSPEPDATAHATRSNADSDEVTAAFPQETAETSAVSRALRNLGILAVPKKPRAPRKSKEDS